MQLITFCSYQGRTPRIELELLSSFRDSVSRSYPEVRLTVLTDALTAKTLIHNGYSCHVVEVDAASLLLDRLCGFRSIVKASEPNSLSIMLDYDMLVLQSIRFPVNDFDCAYTVRANLANQPVNGGFVAYRNTPAAMKIMDEILASYENMSSEDKKWWGDQKCLREVFSQRTTNFEVGLHTGKDSRILFLDPIQYNFTPYDMDVSPKTLLKNLFLTDEMLSKLRDSEKFVLHFKGPRKHLQLQLAWELREGRPYKDHIKSVFLSFLPRLKDEGFRVFLKKLTVVESDLFILNDLAVLALLNEKNLNNESWGEVKKGCIDYLIAVNDFRVKPLTNTSYSVERM